MKATHIAFASAIVLAACDRAETPPPAAPPPPPPPATTERPVTTTPNNTTPQVAGTEDDTIKIPPKDNTRETPSTPSTSPAPTQN